MNPGNHRPSPTIRFWSRAVYILLAVLVVAGLGMKVYWDRAYGTPPQRKQWKQQYQADVESRFDRMSERIQPLRGTATPIDDVEEALGGDLEVTQVSVCGDGETRYEIHDPYHGILAEVRYDRAGVLEFRGMSSSLYKMHQLQPYWPSCRPVEDRVQQLGRLLCPVIGNIFTPIVALPWLALLVLTGFCRPWRPLLFALAWAVVLLSGLVWLMSPAYPLTSVRSVMSNDPLFWAGLLLVITAITWAVQRANRTVDPRQCRDCGYNLTANTTGECSECGAAIPYPQQRYLGDGWA